MKSKLHRRNGIHHKNSWILGNSVELSVLPMDPESAFSSSGDSEPPYEPPSLASQTKDLDQFGTSIYISTYLGNLGTTLPGQERTEENSLIDQVMRNSRAPIRIFPSWDIWPHALMSYCLPDSIFVPCKHGFKQCTHQANNP